MEFDPIESDIAETTPQWDQTAAAKQASSSYFSDLGKHVKSGNLFADMGKGSTNWQDYAGDVLNAGLSGGGKGLARQAIGSVNDMFGSMPDNTVPAQPDANDKWQHNGQLAGLVKSGLMAMI